MSVALSAEWNHAKNHLRRVTLRPSALQNLTPHTVIPACAGMTKVIIEKLTLTVIIALMTNTQTIKTTLTSAATQLNNDEASFEVQLLLQHLLNVNRAWLIAHEHENIPPSIHAAYRALINRRANGEPIAYILGVREFYGLIFKVSPDTLIPRADTETLVEAALAKISQNAQTPSLRREQFTKLRTTESCIAETDSDLRQNDKVWDDKPRVLDLKILDLGTGSGAIALAIAKHRPQAQITALDASQDALDIAIENAQNLNIPNVKLILSDWFSALTNEKFDIIVSNPPYIEASDAHLQQGDLRYEPLSALASGADGLDAIRHIIKNAPPHLNPHGWLMLEHGYHQASQVAALLKQAGFSDISHAKDLSGIDRVTIGRFQVGA